MYTFSKYTALLLAVILFRAVASYLKVVWPKPRVAVSKHTAAGGGGLGPKMPVGKYDFSRCHTYTL